MASPSSVEIERKYLLSGLPPAMPPAEDVLDVEQGYLPGVNVLERIRRQRSRSGVVRHFRSVKLGAGVERLEFEDETDARMFEQLWPLTAGARVFKRRHLVRHGADRWEVDEFTDRPLVLAELELARADATVAIPAWMRDVLVREVTDEPAYTNRSLAR